MATRDIHCSSQMIRLLGHARHLDGIALVDAASFGNPQYRRNAAPRGIESQRSWRNRSSTTEMDPVMTHNYNHLSEENYMAWSSQQRALIDGHTLILDQLSADPYMHGSNTGGPWGTRHRSSMTFLHSTPQNLQHHNYQYPHLLPIPPSRPRIYHSQQEGRVPEASQRHGNLTHLGFLPPEEAAVLELPGDMHLDIEDASYEELLALGERVGNVNTGLSEEIITNKLKTRTYLMSGTDIHLEETAALSREPDLCIICQEEYKNQENIGTLSCGHECHADCLKNWLILKNECPLCRSRGLTLD